jgi:hypothetical protein
MKLSTTIQAVGLSLFAFAACATAMVEPQSRDVHAAAVRALQHRQTGTPSRKKPTDTSITSTGNWCGAAQVVSNISSVKGSWTIPPVSIPEGGSNATQYEFFQWVGIDGMTEGCDTILQAGSLVLVR